MDNNLEKKHFEELMERLIGQDSKLSVNELRQLKFFFSSKNGSEIVEQWLVDNWNGADHSDVNFSFESLKQEIFIHRKQRQFTNFAQNLSHYYQKVAAILILPLLLGGLIYLFISTHKNEEFYVAEAPLGQKAKIELTDGTVVWLNSGTTIKYSSDYNQKGRDIFLDGEAFFEVMKNSDRPFFVHTTFLDIEVTGTKFNVNAYREEPVVETSLVEGKVNLLVKRDHKRYKLTPGESIEYMKQSGKIIQANFKEYEAKSWIDNRLVFVNDDFSKLKRKIERWYNMQVVSDSLDFAESKLTVNLKEGEQLSKLLEIIEVAINADCTVKGNKILITKKGGYVK